QARRSEVRGEAEGRAGREEVGGEGRAAADCTAAGGVRIDDDRTALGGGRRLEPRAGRGGARARALRQGSQGRARCTGIGTRGEEVMAHKKGLGSSRNGRDSNPKLLG